MRGFFGVLVLFCLLNIVISVQVLQEQKTKEMLDSKQRIIDYQNTEQERFELMQSFETKSSAAAKFIRPEMKTPEALAIFCSQITEFAELQKCILIFNIDVFQRRATLNTDLVLDRENFQVVFQKGGYFE